MTLFQKEENYGVKTFTNEDDFMNYLYEVSMNSQWKILNSDNVVFNAENNCLAVTDIAKQKTTKTRETVAFPSICSRCQISGEALSRLDKTFLSKVLTECLKTRPSILLKTLVQYGEISAIHSSEYTPLRMEEIFFLADKEFCKLNDNRSFKFAEWNYKYCTAEYEIDNEEITEAYNEALVRNNLFKSKKNIKLLVRVTSSDVATSGISLSYKVRVTVGNHYIDIPISPKRDTSIKHTGNAEKKMDEFKQKLTETLAIYKANQEQLFKLMGITIYNPLNCLKGMLKKSGIPLKYSNQIVNRFVAVNGDEPCSAYEIYEGMCYLLELVSEEEGNSSANTLRFEELLAKSVTKNFKEFDVTGEIAW